MSECFYSLGSSTVYVLILIALVVPALVELVLLLSFLILLSGLASRSFSLSLIEAGSTFSIVVRDGG